MFWCSKYYKLRAQVPLAAWIDGQRRNFGRGWEIKTRAAAGTIAAAGTTAAAAATSITKTMERKE